MAAILSNLHAQLVQEVIEAREQLARNLAASEEVWCQLDLTMPQLKALMAVAFESSLTITQIGEALGIGRPGASNVVDKLVQMGLVTRAEDAIDRRRTNVGLSGEGTALMARLRQSGEEAMRSCLELLAEDDLAALARGMTALAEATKRQTASAAGATNE